MLKDKVAIVTGGGTGIGKAIAELFAAQGAKVVVAGRRLGVIGPVAAAIGGYAIETDVTREDDAQQLVASTVKMFGGLDILVNNAGISGPVSDVEALDLTLFDETVAINLRGTMACIKHAVPAMRARGGGSIVNMSSLMGLKGYPMRSSYCATKFAVIGLTEAIAHEVGRYNIRVNALCPGAVNGELMERVIARRAAAEGRPPEDIIKANYTDVAALRRWVEPQEVAAAALFFASDSSGSITAERMRVDAGRM